MMRYALLSLAGTNAGAKVIHFLEPTSALSNFFISGYLMNNLMITIAIVIKLLWLLDGVGIGDVPEEEGIAGHRGTGGAAVFALDDLAKFFDGHLVAAHLDEGADDGAYHVAQEAVALQSSAPSSALRNNGTLCRAQGEGKAPSAHPGPGWETGPSPPPAVCAPPPAGASPPAAVGLPRPSTAFA